MSQKSALKKPYLTLPNHTVISLDPLPVPIMITIASLFFLFLAYLFATLPSHSNIEERGYAAVSISEN